MLNRFSNGIVLLLLIHCLLLLTLFVGILFPLFVGCSVFGPCFLFNLIFYVPSTIFQLNRGGTSWI